METTFQNPKFVVLGGGTGSFTILSALKHYVQDLTALVNMTDDGGSTGILRDELGVLPPGDIRQCLVALSDSPHLRELFNFRFPGDGSLAGHTFGNLFLSAVEMQSNDFAEAIKTASEVLRIKGRVVPITLDDCHLVYRNDSGEDIKGEHKIEMTDLSADLRPVFEYEKPAKLNEEARQAILGADMIIIAPGSLYTSLVPLLLVNDVPETIKQSKAKVVYVANLVNKPNETKGYDLDDYVRELERYAGPNVINAVVFNTEMPDSATLDQYYAKEEYPVQIDLTKQIDAHYEVISGNFLSSKKTIPNPDDPLSHIRSLIRHDADAVARALMKIYYS